MLKTLKLIVAILMILLIPLLAGLIFYFYRGSLEEFPTDEQQEKVQVVTGFFIAALLLAEGLLFLVYRKIKGLINKKQIRF